MKSDIFTLLYYNSKLKHNIKNKGLPFLWGFSQIIFMRSVTHASFFFSPFFAFYSWLIVCKILIHSLKLTFSRKRWPFRVEESFSTISGTLKSGTFLKGLILNSVFHYKRYNHKQKQSESQQWHEIQNQIQASIELSYHTTDISGYRLNPDFIKQLVMTISMFL